MSFEITEDQSGLIRSRRSQDLPETLRLNGQDFTLINKGKDFTKTFVQIENRVYIHEREVKDAISEYSIAMNNLEEEIEEFSDEMKSRNLEDMPKIQEENKIKENSFENAFSLGGTISSLFGSILSCQGFEEIVSFKEEARTHLDIISKNVINQTNEENFVEGFRVFDELKIISERLKTEREVLERNEALEKRYKDNINLMGKLKEERKTLIQMCEGEEKSKAKMIVNEGSCLKMRKFVKFSKFCEINIGGEKFLMPSEWRREERVLYSYKEVLLIDPVKKEKKWRKICFKDSGGEEIILKKTFVGKTKL